MKTDLILTGLDHPGRCGNDFRSNKLLHFVFDQFTVHDPRLFGQHVSARAHLGWFEKDVPWRAPVAFIAGELPVSVMRRLLFVLSRFRFSDNRKRWSIRAEEAAHVIARRILADANHLEALVLVLLIQLRRDRSFVAPVSAPRRE